VHARVEGSCGRPWGSRAPALGGLLISGGVGCAPSVRSQAQRLEWQNVPSLQLTELPHSTHPKPSSLASSPKQMGSRQRKGAGPLVMVAPHSARGDISLRD